METLTFTFTNARSYADALDSMGRAWESGQCPASDDAFVFYCLYLINNWTWARVVR